jgi:hypothetical protein
VAAHYASAYPKAASNEVVKPVPVETSLPHHSINWTTVIDAKPIGEVVDIDVSPRWNGTIVPPQNVYWPGSGQNQSGNTPPWHTGNDYEFPNASPDDGDLGGYTNIGTPRAPSGPDELFMEPVEIVDQNTRDVLEMLSGLKYVPREAAEAPEQLSLKIADVAQRDFGGSKPAPSAVHSHSESLEGGMIALAQVSPVVQSRSDDNASTLNIDELLKLPPQMDSSAGKYQAFEMATEEALPLPVESFKQTKSVPVQSVLESLIPETAESKPAPAVDYTTESTDDSGAVTDSARSDVPVSSATGDSTNRVFGVASASAVVLLGFHVARFREHPRRIKPARLSMPATAGQTTTLRHWGSSLWKFLYAPRD